MTAAIISIHVSGQSFSNAAEVHSRRISAPAIKPKCSHEHFGLGVILLLPSRNVERRTEHGIEAIDHYLS
jgi:hypothetical protein